MTFPRREFLQSAALASAASRKLVAQNSKLKAGLIGCGGISVSVANAFMAAPHVDIAMICDVDDAQIAKKLEQIKNAGRPTPQVVKDFRRVIDNKELDIVIVCTPDHWHAIPTIAAFEAGKDVYCEKPLGTTILESRTMRDAARYYNRIAQMGTQWRSADYLKEGIEMVQQGKIGKVRQVRAWAYLDWIKDAGNPVNAAVPAGVDYDMWLGPAPKRDFNPNRFHFNFRWFWDYAGGLMTDWGVHLISVGLWGMEKPGKSLDWPKSVSSSGGKFALQDNTETPDTQIAVYEFPDYNFIWEHQVQTGLGPDRREHGIAFTGSDATMLLTLNGWEIIPEPSKLNKISMKRETKAGEPIRVTHVKNFLNGVANRKDPNVHLDIGHHVSAVSLLGNVALRSKERLEWDPTTEKITNHPEANRLLEREYRAPWKLPKIKSAAKS
jgi:predicted dehydrogenase